MRFYPVFLNLARRPVLIVGGGRVGLRKARGLIDAGAEVHVMSRAFDAGFEGLTVVRHAGDFAPAQLEWRPRWALIFAATDDRAVNERVAQGAAEIGIWCARCDVPDAGDFSGGATHHAGPVVLAVSTSGGSPVLATRLRDAAAEALDPLLIAWAQKSAEWRPVVQERVRDPKVRRELLKRLAGPEMEQAWRGGGAKSAERLFQDWLGTVTNAGGS